MTLTLLSTRDVISNVNFRLSFKIFFGVPSHILCTRGTSTIFDGRGIISGLNYEIVRPLYTSNTEPQVIDASFEQLQTKTGAPYEYSCTVRAEGRKNIVSGSYNYDILGSATSTATVTGK